MLGQGAEEPHPQGWPWDCREALGDTQGAEKPSYLLPPPQLLLSPVVVAERQFWRWRPRRLVPVFIAEAVALPFPAVPGAAAWSPSPCQLGAPGQSVLCSLPAEVWKGAAVCFCK